jgi:hypothetical protein
LQIKFTVVYSKSFFASAIDSLGPKKQLVPSTVTQRTKPTFVQYQTRPP